MFPDARFQSKTHEKLMCRLDHLSIDVIKLRLSLYGWNIKIHLGGVSHVHHTPPPQREFRLSAGGHSAGAQNRQVLFPPGFFCIWGPNGMQWCCPMQLHARNNQNSPSSTQKELKIHGQKGHFWRSRAVEKKIPFKLSALHQTFTCVQTHYKGHFVKVWGRSVEICVQGTRWPDTQKSSKNGHFRGPRAADPQMPLNLSELHQTFTCVQTHYKGHFVKVWGRSVEICVQGNRWPDMKSRYTFHWQKESLFASPRERRYFLLDPAYTAR